LTLNPALLEQRERMLEFQRRVPEFMDAFFGKMLEYRGRRVMFVGTWVSLLQATLAGEKRGIQGLFAADSFSITGGGKKGQVFPDDWYERICRFYGVPQMRASYGMTEMIGLMQECREHKYHPWPHQVVYLLDPESGRLLPREGVQRGRFGYMDLAAETHWGGGVSGDAVTVHWGRKPCQCGRSGPFIDKVERLSYSQAGDDKITCAGAQAAHAMRHDRLTADRFEHLAGQTLRAHPRLQNRIFCMPWTSRSRRSENLHVWTDGNRRGPACIDRHGDHPELFPPTYAQRRGPGRPLHQRHSAPMNNEGDIRGQARSPSIFRSDRASRR
jgi:hypothetical protein